jgi:hypothetical protein
MPSGQQANSSCELMMRDCYSHALLEANYQNSEHTDHVLPFGNPKAHQQVLQ